MLYYCHICNEYIEEKELIYGTCPHCGTLANDMEAIDPDDYNEEEWEPTEEELEAMYEQHYYATQISNKYALYGAI